MSYKHPWQPPYPGISTAPIEERRRLTIDIPKSDADSILSVCLTPAIFSLICQTAIKHTAEHARSCAYTYANSVALVDFICKRTHPQPYQQADGHDDTGGTPSVRPRNAPTSEQPAVARKKVKRGK